MWLLSLLVQGQISHLYSGLWSFIPGADSVDAAGGSRSEIHSVAGAGTSLGHCKYFRFYHLNLLVIYSYTICIRDKD